MPCSLGIWGKLRSIAVVDRELGDTDPGGVKGGLGGRELCVLCRTELAKRPVVSELSSVPETWTL